MKLYENEEYPFVPVPAERRKDGRSLAAIMAGFAFSFASLNLGAELGRQMNFTRAVCASLTGNLCLFLIALIWGTLAYQTGHTCTFVVGKYLGDKMAAVFCCLMIFFLVIWIGVNGDALANLVIAAFPSWRLPFAATALLMVLSITLFSLGGWKGMETLNRIVIPLLILLAFYMIGRIVKYPNGWKGFLVCQPAKNRLPFLKAVVRVIGNFSLSAIMMADICRFAKSRRTVFLCVAIYAGVLFLCDLLGINIAQSTGAKNPAYGIYVLNVAISGFLWVSLCVYTTQNVNMYVGSLALQRLVRKTVMGGSISYQMAVGFLGALAIITGILRIDRHIGMITELLTPFVILLTVLVSVKQRAQKMKSR